MFFPHVDTDECDTSNGGCSQTCTDNDGSFDCSCSAGFRLAADDRTCEGTYVFFW